MNIKIIQKAFLIVFLGTHNLTAQDITSGLIGYWSFDGHANDESGNNMNGTPVGPVLASDRDGNTNRAYAFNGGSDHIVVGDHAPVDNLFHSGATLTAWIYVESTPGTSGVASIITNRSCGNCGWVFFINNSNGSTASIQLMQDFEGDVQNYGRWGTGSDVVPINTWAFVAVSYDGSSPDNSPIFYVNGNKYATPEILSARIPTANTSPVDDSNRQIYIGNRQDLFDIPFVGSIDEISIHDRVLSHEEIFNLYNPEGEFGLVGHWPFSGNADDVSHNALNGTLNGGVGFVADRNGTENSAIELDGVDDYFEVLDNNLLDFGSGDFSVSFWVNKTVANSAHNSSFGVSKWNQGNATPGDNEWSVSIANSFNNDRPSFSIENGTTKYQASSADNISINEWHHIVGLRFGTTTRIYVDGQLKGTQTIPATASVNNVGNSLLIGTGKNQAFFSKSKFDDLSIYNKSLSESEILALYQAAPGHGQDSDPSNPGLFTDKLGVNTEEIPADYHVAVKGKIITEGVTVALSADWPDYVFESDYKLMPIVKVKEYVEKNKHLPNVPSALALKESGVDLLEMNSKLMEKIEELTLYLIDQNDKIAEQNTKVKKLEKRLDSLEINPTYQK